MENITIQVDEQLKARAEALFTALGLDLSTATALFYRQALRYKGLPFDIRLAADEEIPNAETLVALEEAEKGKQIFGFCLEDRYSPYMKGQAFRYAEAQRFLVTDIQNRQSGEFLIISR